MNRNEGNKFSSCEVSNIIWLIIEDRQQILDTMNWNEITVEDENVF
jgi:hypothetical protein